MRKLIALLLISVGAYYFYTRNATSSHLTLPDSIAWRFVTHIGSNSSPGVGVVLLHGDCWRLEWKTPASPTAFTAVFDGSKFASSAPGATVELNPRIPMQKLLASIGPPRSTELHDGRQCWRFSRRYQGNPEQVWVDTQTHFPVFVDGTRSDGTHFDARYSILPIETATHSAKLFDTRSTASQFSQFLTP